MSSRTRTQSRTLKIDRAQRLGGKPVEKPRAGLVAMQNQLAIAVIENDAAEPMLQAVLDIVMKIPRVIGAGFLTLDSDGLAKASPAQFGGVVFGRGDYLAHLSQVCRSTLESQFVTAVPSPDIKNLTTICAMIGVEQPVRQAIAIAVADTPDQLEAELLIPQMVASYIALWQLSHATGRLDSELNATAAVLELVGRMGDCKSPKMAAYTIANELRDFFGCEQVGVGFAKDGGQCSVSAVSGLADFDRQSKIVRTMRSAFDETIVRDQQIVFPTEDGDQRHGLLSHKQLAESLNAESIISCPLKNSDGETNGVISFVGKQETLNQPNVLNVISTIPEPLGSSLQLIRKAQGGLLRRMCSKLWSGLATKPGRLIAVGSIAAIAAMFIPVTYRVRTSCTAEPVTRRMSVAPHEGLLEVTHAEPGDIVKSGQLLAKMDGREIRWELAGMEAESQRAGKKRDAAFVHQNVPEAQMAKLELESLTLQMKLLKFKEQNLEIRSPIDGIVLSGSLDRRENYPVTIGQALYEIAPLNELRIQVAVPDDEIVNVGKDDEVNITFDGVGGDFDGVIERIHPRADVRDGKNIFIAEVTLDNPEGVLRPGMAGVARVYGQERSLGWTLFHKPWEHIVSWVRW